MQLVIVLPGKVRTVAVSHNIENIGQDMIGSRSNYEQHHG